MASVVQDVKVAAQDAGIIEKPAATAQPAAEAQPAAVAQPVATVQPTGAAPPQGAPAGGMWIEENYRGTVSCLACLFVPLCGMCVMCCCPLDKRTVYVANQVKYNQMGAIVT